MNDSIPFTTTKTSPQFDWLTLQNYNPITVVEGVNLGIKTSNPEHAGQYQIRKNLKALSWQVVTHTVNICFYKPATLMFQQADASLTLLILSIPNHEDCVEFFNWEVQTKPTTPCATCLSASCGTVYTTMSNYYMVKGGVQLTSTYNGDFKWEDNTTNKKLCWKVPAGGWSSGSQTLTYSLKVSGQPNSQIQEFKKTFTATFKSCSEFTVVDPTPWLKDKT